MTPAKFIAKWAPVTPAERAASQEHFLDPCRLLGQPTPAEIDATGAEYTFEKGVAVTDSASRGSRGAGGFADVWWRGKFAWEYKRKGKYRSTMGTPLTRCMGACNLDRVRSEFGLSRPMPIVSQSGLRRPNAGSKRVLSHG